MLNPDIWQVLMRRRGGNDTRLHQEMNKAYDIAFGIFSHGADVWTPLKSVAQHPAEDPWRQLGRQSLIEQYDTYGIKEYMTLPEFMKAEFPLANSVVEKAIRRLRQQAAEQEEEEERLQREEAATGKGRG